MQRGAHLIVTGLLFIVGTSELQPCREISQKPGQQTFISSDGISRFLSQASDISSLHSGVSLGYRLCGISAKPVCRDQFRGCSVSRATKDPTKIINRVRFLHGISTGAALGHYMFSDVYRAFHRSKCYELRINITSTEFSNFEPGAVKEFTRRDEQRVRNELTTILNSFRFLK
jgi:hypothetical protein